MTHKQTATKIRNLLRTAGPMNRVRIEWIRTHLGLPVEAVVEAIPHIETRTFRLYRQSGQGACLAMA